MANKTEEILEQLKTLTLLEVSDLVEKLEKTFNIDSSIGSSFASGGSPTNPAPVQAEEEKTEFDVILSQLASPDKKLSVLKLVRTLTGLGLKEAKELVESLPKPVKEKLSKNEADALKKEIEGAGGVVLIK